MTFSYRNTWTLGAHSAPGRNVNVTAHLRQRNNNNDYDDKRESQPGAATARSAFIDLLNTDTLEWMTRVAWKPKKWFQLAVRYQLRKNDYTTRVEDQDAVDTDMRSNIFTYDLTFQPSWNWTGLISFSQQDARTWTPARSSSAVNIPAFDADVYAWLFTLEYLFSEKLNFFGGFQYSWADNFNNFSGVGLPLGMAFERFDLTAGADWALAKNVSIGPHYGFYKYETGDSEFGDYVVNIFSVTVSVKWA